MSDETNNYNAQSSDAVSGEQNEVPGVPLEQPRPETGPAGAAYRPGQPVGVQNPYAWSAAPQGVPMMPQCVPACGNYVDPSKKNRKWWILLAAVVVICLTFAFSVTMCSASVASLFSSSVYEEATVSPSVAVITLDGEIDYDDSSCSPEGFKLLLDEAADDPNIVAVVLRVNSGGGVATAGEEMTTYLRQFMETTGKPVVVSSAATNASAAYEISSQADYIFTAKSTAIGAIGTAMQLADYSGLLKMLGIEVTNLTSADSKDSTYGTRALTDEEIEAYQHQIDQINEVFIESVAAGRNMTIDQVTALATGLTFTGIDAVSNGLADEIGTLEDATDMAANLAGVDSYYVYELSIYSSDLGSVVGTLFGASTNSSQSNGYLMKEYSDVKSVQ